MLNEQDITERLRSIGYKEAQIRLALRDVGQIIFTKTLLEYIRRLPEEHQARLKELPEAEAARYVAQNADTFPPMPQADFEKIADETWEDYFSSVA